MKTRMLMVVLSALSASAIAAGCGGGKNDTGSGTPVPVPSQTPFPGEAAVVTQARGEFPRFLDVQVGILSSTCSPNPNVCHNQNNYPNVMTAGNTISFLKQPCNAEIPDPLAGWDNCERKAGTVQIGSFATKIAWMQRIGPGTWTVGYQDPAPVGGLSATPIFRDDNAVTILSPVPDWQVLVVSTAGAMQGSLSVGGDDFIHDFIDSILKTVVQGDPNRNGIYGGDDPTVTPDSAAEVFPGSPARSYLWGRITGTVPGSRMPLANAPITYEGYVAIACWIEGLKGDGSDGADDPIDYSGCSFAHTPIDYSQL